MKYTMKKTLAFLMVLFMVFQAIPTTAFAGTGISQGGQFLRGATPERILGIKFQLLGNCSLGTDSNYYLIIRSANGENDIAYAALSDGNNNNYLTLNFKNDGVTELTSPVSFAVIKSNDNPFDIHYYSYAYEVTLSGQEIDGIPFTWETDPDDGYCYLYAGENTATRETSETKVHFVDSTYTPVEATFNQYASTKYYLIAKLTNGSETSYDYKQVTDLSAEYLFDIADTIDIRLYVFNNNQMYDHDPNDASNVYNGNLDEYRASCINQLTTGDKIGDYTITGKDGQNYILAEPVRGEHTANLTKPDDIDIENLYILFRQDLGLQEKCYYLMPVEAGNTTYTTGQKFRSTDGAEIYYDTNGVTEVSLLKVNNPNNFQINQSYSFQQSQIDQNTTSGNITVYTNGDYYPDEQSSNMVSITPGEDNNHTTITISAPEEYGAELHLYQGWNIRDTGVPLASEITVTAEDVTDPDNPVVYTATVIGDGAITFKNGEETVTPHNKLTNWKIDGVDAENLTLQGYTFTVKREGFTYILEGHQPDTYGIRIDYYEAWIANDDPPTGSSATLPEDIDVTLTGKSGDTTYYGRVQPDGTVVMTEGIPKDVNINNWNEGAEPEIKLGEYRIKGEDRRNPTKDEVNHEYVFKAKKPNEVSIKVEYYEQWGTSPLPEVSISGGEISAQDKPFRWKIETDGSVTIIHAIPEHESGNTNQFVWIGVENAIAPSFILESKNYDQNTHQIHD